MKYRVITAAMGALILTSAFATPGQAVTLPVVRGMRLPAPP